MQLILGDNQFFGVNHMSEERARAQAIRFQDNSAIMKVIEDAYSLGIRSFMCTTHDRIGQLVSQVKAAQDRFADFAFEPCMPYAHKYSDAVTEAGLLGALRRFLPEDGLLSAALRGGRSLARKDVEGVITLLIEAEMVAFRGVGTPTIWLQNVVVDLLLGMGFLEPFRIFESFVRERYGAQAGFITMNLPLLLRALDEIGVVDPLICANINKLGFRMSGGIDAYQTVLAERPFRAVAMSVFASGAIPPREAIGWIIDQPNIESIVFGASTREHIEQTVSLVHELS